MENISFMADARVEDANDLQSNVTLVAALKCVPSFMPSLDCTKKEEP